MRAMARSGWVVALACVVTVGFTRSAAAQSTTNRLSTVVNAVISGTRDPQTGVVTPGDGPSGSAAFSPDRRLVLFTSTASNLEPVPDVDGGSPDLFLHVLATGTNVPLTTTGLLDDATARHGRGVFSTVIATVPGGLRYTVAFVSESLGPAGQPDPADTPGTPDLFVASFTLTPSGDVVDPAATRLTVGAGVVADDDTGPTLAWSSDGSRVAFLAQGNIDGHPFEDTLAEPNGDLFVATVATGAIERLTLNDGGSVGGVPSWPRGLAWSPDQTAIAFHAITGSIDVTGDGVSDVAPSTYVHGRSDVYLLRLDQSPRTIARVTADPLTGESAPTNTGSFVGAFSPLVVPGQLPELFISTDIAFPPAGEPIGINGLAQIVALSSTTGGWTARTVSLDAAGGPANGGADGASTAGNSGPFVAATVTGRLMVGFSSTAQNLWDGADVGPTGSPAAQAYLADGAGAVALLSRTVGPRVPANDASTGVTVAPGQVATGDVAFLAGQAAPLWTLAAFSTLATDLAPVTSGIPQVVVSAVAPGPSTMDDTFRATIERATYMSYDTLLANDAPGVTFVGLVGPTTGPTHFIQDDTNTRYVRVNHLGTEAETLTFQYEVQDVTGARFTSTVTMHVNNRRPSPTVDINVPVTPGLPTDVLLTDIASHPGNGDPDGDSLIVGTYGLVDPGALGTFSGVPGGFRFTPAAAYTGGYEFHYGLKDVVDYGGAESDSYGFAILRFVVAPALPSIDFGPTAYIPCCEGTAPGPAGSITVTLERRGDLSRESTVNYTVSAGPAPSASTEDLVEGFGSGSITFAANQVWAAITIRTTPDSLDEVDENVLLTLAGATGATLARTSLYQAIYDDDLPPASADVSVTLAATPQVVEVQQPVRIVALVANGSVGEATNVTFSGLDSIVGTHSIDSVTASQGTCAPVEPPSPVRCTLGTLPNGTTATITIVARPTASVFQGTSQLTTSVTMHATVAAAESDPSPADNTTSGGFEVRRQGADLSLTASLADSQVMVGGTSTATIAVRNAGPDTASGSVRVALAASSVVDASPGYDPATQTWTFGPVPSGGAVALTLTVRFDTLGNAGVAGEIVTASLPDPDSTPGSGSADGEDDAAAAAVTVIARRPNLRAFKFALNEVGQQVSTVAVTEGATVVFQMGAVNQVTGGMGVGPTTGTVTLTDTLPAGLAFVATASDPRCTAQGQVVTCVDGAIVPANGSVRFFVATSVRTGIAPGGSVSLYNAAVVSTPDDVMPDDNTSFAVTIAVTRPGEADLAVRIGSSAAMVETGQAVTITAVVTNNGPSPATGVVLRGFADLTVFTALSMTTTQGRCPVLILIGPPAECVLGTLAAGASATVTFTGTPTAALFTGSGGTVLPFTTSVSVSATELDADGTNNAGAAGFSVTHLRAPDLRIATATFEHTDGSPLRNPPRIDDVVQLRVVVENVGDAVSGTARLSYRMPGLTVIYESPLPCNGLSPCQRPDILPGGSLVLHVRVRVIGASFQAGQTTADLAGTVTVVHQAQSSFSGVARDPERNLANNAIGTTLTVRDRRRPDLRITLAEWQRNSGSSISSARTGDEVYLMLLVENAGPARSGSMRLGVNVPGLVFLGNDLSCSLPPCSWPALAPGATQTLRARFRVGAAPAVGGQTVVSGTATVEAPSVGESDLANNSTAVSLTVLDRRRPDLRITYAGWQRDFGRPIGAARTGDEVYLVLVVENAGSVRSGSMRLAVNVPGLVFLGNDVSCSLPPCSWPGLVPGASQSLRARFRVGAAPPPGGQTVVSGTATVESPSVLESDHTNNAIAVSLTVLERLRPDLRIAGVGFYPTLSAGDTPIATARVGDEVELRVLVENVGTATSGIYWLRSEIPGLTRLGQVPSCPSGLPSCSSPDLGVGASNIVRVRFRITPLALGGQTSAVVGGTVLVQPSTNSTTGTSRIEETNRANNFASTTLTVLRALSVFP